MGCFQSYITPTERNHTNIQAKRLYLRSKTSLKKLMNFTECNNHNSIADFVFRFFVLISESLLSSYSLKYWNKTWKKSCVSINFTDQIHLKNTKRPYSGHRSQQSWARLSATEKHVISNVMHYSKERNLLQTCTYHQFVIYLRGESPHRHLIYSR